MKKINKDRAPDESTDRKRSNVALDLDNILQKVVDQNLQVAEPKDILPLIEKLVWALHKRDCEIADLHSAIERLKMLTDKC